MSKVCAVSGRQLSPCETLSNTLEYGNPGTKSKGVFLPERVNIRTREKGTSIVQLHSGNYIGRGVAACFCPFCGTNIETWSNKN